MLDKISKLKELGFITENEVAEETIRMVDKARKGELLFLKTRNEELNHSLGRGFDVENGQIILLFAPPSHGKSHRLRMFTDDFVNKEINGELVNKILIIRSLYEGHPFQEAIRHIGEKEGKTYNYLLSSEFNQETGYNKVSDKGFEVIKQRLDERKELPIIYVPVSSKNTVFFVMEKIYKIKEMFPELLLVWQLDHYLLSSDPYNDIGKLITDTANVARFAKREIGLTSIILGQTNNEHLKLERRTKPVGHYFTQDDIYFGGTLFQACDTVIGMYQPNILNIDYFGFDKIYTKPIYYISQELGFSLDSKHTLFSNGIIPLMILKGRNTGTGIIYESNRLDINKVFSMHMAEKIFRQSIK